MSNVIMADYPYGPTRIGQDKMYAEAERLERLTDPHVARGKQTEPIDWVEMRTMLCAEAFQSAWDIISNSP